MKNRVEEFGPRYQNSPARLEYEREKASTYITDKQYLQMIEKLKGTKEGNLLKATAYIDGVFGYEQDFKKALLYFNKAAEQGSADAMYNLGVMNEKGLGAPKNIDVAIGWWNKAIAQDLKINGQDNSGVIESYAALGSAYANGNGVQTNGAKAIEYWEKAAQHGYDVALNNLGSAYEHGTIVPRNIDKARMYYNAAAMKGAVTAMYNLGALEVDEGDQEKGRKWLTKAANQGHPQAQAALTQLLASDHLVSDLIDKYKAFTAGVNKNQSRTQMHSTHLVSKYPIEQLAEAAPNSQIAADMLNAKLCSIEALEYLEKEEDTILQDKEKMRKFASLAAGCYKITEIVFEYPSRDRKQLAVQVFNKLHSIEPDNVDAMLGLVMATENVPQIMQQLEKWISQGKKIPRMYGTLSLIHLNLQNLQKSLQAINKAIQEEPDYGHYFVRGSIYRMMGKKKEGIADFDTYLRNIDQEDRKIPNAYFGKAQLYLNDKELDKAQECFLIGCQKDEEALPFFKHKEATQKEMTKQMLELFGATTKLKRNNTTSKPMKQKELVKFGKDWEMKYNDVRRIEIVTGFREVIRNGRANPKSEKLSMPPRNHQPPPPSSSATLKPIFLEDIEYKDKVYEGYILSCKIIEMPSVLAGTYTLIEDDHGQVQKIGFYNFDISDEKKAKEIFWLGKRISIINPYMRIGSSDNKPFIRVEIVESVISHPGEYYSACALCQSLATMRCSRCHATSYCSKRCQEIDWKNFKHKLICEPVVNK